MECRFLKKGLTNFVICRVTPQKNRCQELPHGRSFSHTPKIESPASRLFRADASQVGVAGHEVFSQNSLTFAGVLRMLVLGRVGNCEFSDRAQEEAVAHADSSAVRSRVLFCIARKDSGLQRRRACEGDTFHGV